MYSVSSMMLQCNLLTSGVEVLTLKTLVLLQEQNQACLLAPWENFLHLIVTLPKFSLAGKYGGPEEYSQ